MNAEIHDFFGVLEIWRTTTTKKKGKEKGFRRKLMAKEGKMKNEKWLLFRELNSNSIRLFL